MGAHPGTAISRLGRGAVIGAVAALAGGFAIYGGMASAAPWASRPSAKQAQQQLNKLISQDDRLGNLYDQTLASYAASTKKLKLVDSQMALDKKTFQGMRSQVGRIAATAYETGDETSVSAIIASGNPEQVLDQAGTLEHISSFRLSAMRAYIGAAQSLRGAQTAAQRTQATIAQQKDKLATEKTSLDATVAKQKKLVASLSAPVEPGARSTPKPSPSATARPAPSPSATPKPSPPPSPKPPPPSKGSLAAQFASNQIGKPYVWGATGPDSYDCSGLVQAAWSAAGVSIPRDTYSQWAALPHIPQSDIQVGDLLFYDAEGHVAIYVGGGMIIDAPQPGENVEKISMNESWYAQNFDGAARP